MANTDRVPFCLYSEDFRSRDWLLPTSIKIKTEWAWNLVRCAMWFELLALKNESRDAAQRISYMVNNYKRASRTPQPVSLALTWPFDISFCMDQSKAPSPLPLAAPPRPRRLSSKEEKGEGSTALVGHVSLCVCILLL